MEPTILSAYKHILRMNERQMELLIGMYNRNTLNQCYVQALEIIDGLPSDD